MPDQLGHDEPKRDKKDKEAAGDAQAGKFTAQDQPHQDVGIDRDSQHERDERQGEQLRGKIDEATRDATALGLPMIGGRRHDESHGQGQEDERGKVQDLAALAQLRKTLIENGNQLKTQNCLHTRQDHARLVGRMGGLFLERFAVHFFFHRIYVSRGPGQRRTRHEGCALMKAPIPAAPSRPHWGSPVCIIHARLGARNGRSHLPATFGRTGRSFGTTWRQA